MNRCASVDIKFTISPTVDSCLAEFEILNAWNDICEFIERNLKDYDGYLNVIVSYSCTLK